MVFKYFWKPYTKGIVREKQQVSSTFGLDFNLWWEVVFTQY